MRQKVALAFVGLLLIAAAAAAVVVLRRNATEKAEQQAQAQQAKAVSQANEDIVLPGTIGALAVVNVPVTISGIVKAIHAETGADVYEGQLLAEIENQGLEAAQAHAVLELEEAQNRVNNLESYIAAARLEASRANADAIRARSEFDKASRNYARQRLLYAEGATPRNVFEKAETDYKALEAESQNLTEVARIADDRVSALNRDLDAARKLLEGRVADMESSKLRVEAGQVLSPVSGVVAGHKADAGSEVNPAMEDFFQIATDLSRLVVSVEPPPSDLARIKPGQDAGVSLADVPDEILPGTVVSVEENKVRIEFANPSSLVKPGLSAQVRIRVAAEAAH